MINLVFIDEVVFSGQMTGMDLTALEKSEVKSILCAEQMLNNFYV